VQSKFHKFAKAIIISAFAAVVTPALGAGVVAGTAKAVQVVADASTPARLQAVDSNTADDARDDSGVSAGPRRLSPLAGTDDRAWNNAKSVHVHLFAKKAR
jgi:hypothetical protein